MAVAASVALAGGWVGDAAVTRRIATVWLGEGAGVAGLQATKKSTSTSSRPVRRRAKNMESILAQKKGNW
jgi:hypothetical protein